MKKTLTTLAILFTAVGSVCAQVVPELLYYKFDGTGTSVPNLASSPPPGTTTATIMGGQTQGSSGQCGGALVGTGGSSANDYVNTGWVTSLTGSWTISFWTSNVPSTTTVYYILGDATAGGLRVFTGGVAMAGNWILRGPLTDVFAYGGASTGPSVTTFVYDSTAGNITSYVNGVLSSTVAQSPITLSGTGPFIVGGYSSSAGLPSGSLMDEFRFYNRALTATEVAGLMTPYTSSTANITACTSYVSPAGYTRTSSGTYQDTIPNSGGCDSIITTNLVIVYPSSSTINPTACVSYTAPGGAMLTASGTYLDTIPNVNGCDSVITINLTIHPLPTVALGSDIIQCSGSVVLDAGNAGSTFLWSDASTSQMLTVTSSGTYSAMVTDGNGCSNSDTIMVTINPLPTVSLGADTTQCSGSVTLDAGNAGSAFLWSDASTSQMLTVTSSGTYSAMVTDVNGCSNSDTIMVTINPLPTVSLGPDITQCGGTATLDAGNAGSAYLWNDGSTTQTLTVISSGTYSVTVTDGNGCSNADTVLATINTPPTVTGTATSTTVCVNDGNVALTGTPAGGTWSGTGVSGSSFSPATAGTGAFPVNYSYTDGNGCSGSASTTITVNACTGVEEQSLLNAVNVYPNPNNGLFTIAVNADVNNMLIVITDLQGRVVYSSAGEKISAGFTKQVSLESEATGLYLMQISGNGETHTVKISVQR